jgi:DNA-binding NarL/FixJ family response regulator
VARGYSNKAIAACLKISTRTVEGHVASIFGRLSIRALAAELLEGYLLPSRHVNLKGENVRSDVPTLLFRLA